MCAKIKTKKYTRTKEGKRNEKKMNLYLNGAILIFVCFCPYFYNVRGIEQENKRKKRLFNAGHLQIVNSCLIVQQTKQHKASTRVASNTIGM